LSDNVDSYSSKSKESRLDPLLECLVFLTAHYGRSKSAQALVSGLAYGQSDIYAPETQSERHIKLSDLKKIYSGYSIYAHPVATASGKFEADNDAHENDNSRHWFWGPMLECKTIYLRVALAAILVNIFALTSPIFIMNIYNRVIPNNAIETGWVLGIGALTVFVFDFILRTLRGYFIDLAGRRIDVIAGRRIYDQLLNIKLAERPNSSGSFASMLKDFDSVRDFITSATLTTIIDLPFAFLFLFVIWMLGGPIAFVLAALIAVVFVAGVLLQFPLKSLVKKSTKSAEAKHGLLIESIHGLETIKAVGADGKMRERYGQLIAENSGYAQKSRFVSALGVNISSYVQQTASIFVVLLGMYLVKDGVMSVGALIACVLLGGRAIAPIGQMANLMSRYHGARTALKTLNNIMDKPVERPADKQFLHRPSLKGQIAFRKVSFSYPKTNRKVIDNVSFTIEAGEKVGVIGRIGSGKSTLSRLSMGLYDPDEGTILLDNTDYRQIDPADLRRNVAYIAQDVVLFNGTVRDNIIASMPHASEEEILFAAKAAGVDDFISRHPMGYDAPVGERGEGLSGGQRQCVALARAMLLKPNLYICDEPTNAMDTQAENSFVEHIQEQTKDKTLILITHRHHLLVMVDRLILMDQGRVVMDGPRDDVIKAINAGKIQVPKD